MSNAQDSGDVVISSISAYLRGDIQSSRIKNDHIYCKKNVQQTFYIYMLTFLIN